MSDNILLCGNIGLFPEGGRLCLEKAKDIFWLVFESLVIFHKTQLCHV